MNTESECGSDNGLTPTGGDQIRMEKNSVSGIPTIMYGLLRPHLVRVLSDR